MTTPPPLVRIDLDAPPRLSQLAVRTHLPGTEGTYRLPGLWCLHFYRYHAALWIDGRPLEVRPGTVGFTPPGAEATYRWSTRSTHGYAHFALAGGGAEHRVPLLAELGERFEGLYRLFEEALAGWAMQPRRAEARVWEILWQLVERAPLRQAPAGLHPAVAAAVRRIELGLAEPLGIERLAAEVGLSHNHLLRLFHATFGTTVAGYIRRRRAEHARHLLVESTLPIKSIAAEVGIPDLHRFNKTIRRELGGSPREVRARG